MNAKDNSGVVQPETLVEAVRVFGDEDRALGFMVNLRWGGMDKVCCPRCGSVRVRFISTRKVWECREDHPAKRFSVKTGTIMEESPLKLGTWLVAIWLEANAKNSISSYEVMRSLGVTQKTGWFMQQRIRLAMQSGDFFRKLTGEVEVDETFIGGMARNMHKGKRKAKGRGAVGKTVVMGLLERHGIEPFHLFRYLDAETYRFNNRKMDDGQRFVGVVKGIGGKRLTYKALIGEDGQQPDAAPLDESLGAGGALN